MNIFNRSRTEKAVHGALREANGLWERAAKTGAAGLADAGDRAEDVWTHAKSHALDAWQDAKVQAERGFQDALTKAERTWRRKQSGRWDRVARKPVTAVIVIGVAVGLAALLASLRRPEPDQY